MSIKDPAKLEATYRGETFSLVEIDAADYDDCVQRATTTKYDSEGEEQESIDQTLLFRLMLEKSLVTPKLTLAEIAGLGMRLVRQLERDVQTLHFSLEPETDKARKKKAAVKDEDDSPNGGGA